MCSGRWFLVVRLEVCSMLWTLGERDLSVSKDMDHWLHGLVFVAVKALIKCFRHSTLTAFFFAGYYISDATFREVKDSNCVRCDSRSSRKLEALRSNREIV